MAWRLGKWRKACTDLSSEPDSWSQTPQWERAASQPKEANLECYQNTCHKKEGEKFPTADFITECNENKNPI